VRLLPIAFLFFSASVCPALDTGCIEGKVLDIAGAPIPWIQVIGTSPAQGVSFEVGTDSEGYFRIDSIPAGEYDLFTGDEVRGKLPNGRLNIDNSVAPTKSAATGQCSSVTMRRLPRARIRLAGKDLLTSQPISSVQARFRLNGQTEWRGFSDGQDLLVPPLTDLVVQLDALGYEESELVQTALQPGEQHELTVALRPTQIGCISGKVLDQSGVPVSGVRVQPDLAGEHLARQPGVRVTDKNGGFKFERVQPGSYNVFANAPTMEYPLPFDIASTVMVPASSGCAEITINLGPKAARLELKVIDAFTRQPLQGFTAHVFGGDGAHNSWSFAFIANPMPIPALITMSVSAAATGYQAAKDVAFGPLQPEETQQLTIELLPLGRSEQRSKR
jgi:carboxypeptidase family protein